jgi:hypothetical protein
MTGLPKQRLVNEVEKGFSHLPPGCHIQLDRISNKRVLESLKEACNHSWRNLAKELSAYSALRDHSSDSLVAFMRDTGVELSDIYSGSGSSPRGWTALRRKAGLLREVPTPMEEVMSSKVSNMIEMNDPNILKTIDDITSGRAENAQMDHLNILAAELFPSPKDPCTGKRLMDRLKSESQFCSELKQLSALLLDSSSITNQNLQGCPHHWPLVLHGRYGVREIAIGTGKVKPDSRHLPREGVIRYQDEKVEMLLVTLDKSTGFKTTTSYHDYAISPELFHWQSQNSAGPETKAGKRYCPGQADGWTFQLFVRENKEMPYCALGEVVSQKAEGSKPMSVTFQLTQPMMTHLFEKFSILRAS